MFLLCLRQTIVTAMSTLTPPVQLACAENRHRIEYILNLVSQKDFDFPSVSRPSSRWVYTADLSLNTTEFLYSDISSFVFIYAYPLYDSVR